jgi:protein O-mannosyl-transferase
MAVKKSGKTNSAIQQKTVSDLTLRLILALVSTFLYINTTGYKFTLDDDMFYLKHASVQKGLSAFPDLFSKGSLNQFDGTTGVQPYRPITLLSFALENQFFNNSPAASHLMNVLLYVLLIQVLFLLLKKLFDKVQPLLIACIVMIYAVHPIHTEVVCSVKSRDEILAALFGFMAWFTNLRSTDIKAQIVSAFYLFLALLSKESAIAFLVIIPLSKWLIKEETIPGILKQSSFAIAVTLLFLGIRFMVIGNEPSNNGLPLLENVLNGATSIGEASATRMVILFHYLRLTILPWPLNWDYSYNQIPIVDWSSLTALFSIIVHGALIILALLNLKKHRWLSFIILFYFISTAPTNNLFFINGATVGERFLFVPSLAFPLAFVLIVDKLLKADTNADKSRRTLYFSSAVALLFSSATLVRSADWKDNFSLFKRGVEVSPNSSRTNYSLANSYFQLAQETTDPQLRTDYMSSALSYYKRSLEIFPDNFQALYNSGIAYAVNGDTISAIQCYQRTISLKKNYISAYNNLGVLYQSKMNFDSAYYYYDIALKLDPNAPAAKPNLSNLFFAQGLMYSRLQKQDKAIEAYKHSLEYNPQNPMPLVNLASIYAQMAQYADALKYLKMGYAADPGNMMVIENIAAVSYLNKEYEQAITYANKALSIDSNRRKSLGVLADTYQALGNMNESIKYRQRWNSLAQ